MIRHIKRMEMKLEIVFQDEAGDLQTTNISWDSESKHASVEGTLYSSDIWMLNNLVRSLNGRVSPPKRKPYDNRRRDARQSHY